MNLLAIHEAGHTVASAILRLNLQFVTLERVPQAQIPGFETVGHTLSLPGPDATTEDKLKLTLCGLFAEIKAQTGRRAEFICWKMKTLGFVRKTTFGPEKSSFRPSVTSREHKLSHMP